MKGGGWRGQENHGGPPLKLEREGRGGGEGGGERWRMKSKVTRPNPLHCTLDGPHTPTKQFLDPILNLDHLIYTR